MFPGSEDKGAGGKGASPQRRFGSGEWGKCVLNRVVSGVFEAGAGGGIVAWLAKGKYAQVASYLIRVVGPAALKGAVSDWSPLLRSVRRGARHSGPRDAC